jgi:uncharacterized repeat protein (TIGR02543 family)
MLDLLHGNGNTSGTVPGTVGYATGDSSLVYGSNGLIKTGYAFGGWNTAADGTGTTYTEGTHITMTANITLYAVWIVQPVATSITVSSTAYSPAGAIGTNLISSFTNTDDSFLKIDLPFSTNFGGNMYSSIYVGTNSYITFAGGSSNANPGPTMPTLDRILMVGGDRVITALYVQTNSSSWNIRYEGYSFGNPSELLVWEASATSSAPNIIKVQTITNDTTSGNSGVWSANGSIGSTTSFDTAGTAWNIS